MIRNRPAFDTKNAGIIRVEGLQEVQRLLTEQLPARARSRVLTRALRAAAVPMRDAARLNAAGLGGSGALATAMAIWSLRKGRAARDTVASVEIGPRRSNKAALAKYFSFYGKKPTPKRLAGGLNYGHLVEWGTKRTPPRRFMQRAFDAHAERAVEIFRRDIGGFIEREAIKIGAQNGVKR
jgi:HK97 gp10 family phage protein